MVKLNPAGSGLAYATFLGGGETTDGYAIAVDGAGRAYVTGGTILATSRPRRAPSTPASTAAPTDAFVVKLNPDGSGLAYATFLGGVATTLASGIAVDGAGAPT